MCSTLGNMPLLSIRYYYYENPKLGNVREGVYGLKFPRLKKKIQKSRYTPEIIYFVLLLLLVLLVLVAVLGQVTVSLVLLLS